ncbi:SAVMC3_10250 family protein [Micromonospora zamorensis]|uniref:SAVMC3_10250 family protein n=1 Tax=Micromonospora zamorensis TaxID=709883 RepID=UPI002E20C44D
MTTDNSPRQYIYLSRRLLTERYQQHVANRGTQTKLSMGVKTPLGSINFQGRDVDGDNLYQLANVVTEAARDNTGSLLDPGPYVRTTLDLTWGVVNFVDPNDEVAWFYAQQDAGDDVEPGSPYQSIFLALCGSVGNYVGYAPGANVGSQQRWQPSTPDYMRQVVRRYGLEADDAAEIDRINAMLGSAYSISMGLREGNLLGEARLEVLFQVHHYAEGIEISASRGSRLSCRMVLVGSPLWVATALPEPERFDHRGRLPIPAASSAVGVPEPRGRSWFRRGARTR